MEEQKKRKLTRKRCPVGTRYDKTLNPPDCVPIKENPSILSNILPKTIFGNVLDIQKPEQSNQSPDTKEQDNKEPEKKQTRKRCGKGKHYNPVTGNCDDKKVKPPRCENGTRRSPSGKCTKTRKISSSFEKVEKTIQEHGVSEFTYITNSKRWNRPRHNQKKNTCMTLYAQHDIVIHIPQTRFNNDTVT